MKTTRNPQKCTHCMITTTVHIDSFHGEKMNDAHTHVCTSEQCFISAETSATLQWLGSGKISKFPACCLEEDNWTLTVQMTNAEPAMALRRVGLHKEENPPTEAHCMVPDIALKCHCKPWLVFQQPELTME